MWGGGFANVLDTYLSPLEYEGGEVRMVFESMRNTRWMKGSLKAQHLLQVNYSYSHNLSQTAHMHTGLINYNYALHYQFYINKQLKILAGPMLDLNGGVIYNQRNSNNPAQAKAYGGIGAASMLVYRFHIGNYPLLLRYQVYLPLLGVMFSPEYGESYYEIFSLKNGGRNVLFTSLHNNPSSRQLLTLDLPIGNTIVRVGYVCDLQQSKVNGLKNHVYSHDFMLGFVRNIYWLNGRNHFSTSLKKTPF